MQINLQEEGDAISNQTPAISLSLPVCDLTVPLCLSPLAFFHPSLLVLPFASLHLSFFPIIHKFHCDELGLS